MTRSINIMHVLTAAVALMAAQNVSAKPIFTFSDIEYDRNGAEATRAGQRLIADAITTGMPAAQAVGVLKHAGAHCKVEIDVIHCTHDSFEAVEDAPHDVAWTIDLAIANGAVTSTTVKRESIGS